MSFTVRPIRHKKPPSTIKALIRSVSAMIAASRVLKSFLKRKHELEKEEKGARTGLRVLGKIAGITVLIVIAVAIGAKVLVATEIVSFHNVATVAGAPIATDEHGYTNILLLGAGDENHEGIDLTDMLMIASIDADTESAVLLSLPRDLYALRTEKMGKGRINSLYRDYKYYLMRQGKAKEEAAAESLRQLGIELGTLIGVEIHEVIKIDFQGFTQAIDALGGIDVDVPEDIVDTQYPGPNYSYETFEIHAGRQHLDGATALKYARSRHSTSDFSRSARQQQIIAAAGDALTNGGLLRSAGKLKELVDIAAASLETTMNSRQLLTLGSLGKSIDSSKMVSMQLNDVNGFNGLIDAGGFLYAPPRDQFDGASVLLPVSIPEFPVTWKQIQALINVLFLNRALFFEKPRIAVFNAGAVEGSARLLGTELARYGFDVTGTKNYDRQREKPAESFIAVRPQPADQSHANESMANTKEFLASTLELSDAGTLDDLTLWPDDADIMIVVTKGYRYTPLQDLLK